MFDPHQILGVPWNADPRHIRAAYRKRAAELHPDRNRAPDAAARLKEVIEAYRFLSNPGRDYRDRCAAPDPEAAATVMDPAELRRQYQFRYFLEKLIAPRESRWLPRRSVRCSLAVLTSIVLSGVFLLHPSSVVQQSLPDGSLQDVITAAVLGCGAIVFAAALVLTPATFGEIPVYTPRRGLEPIVPDWLIETYGWLLLVALSGALWLLTGPLPV